MSAVSGYLTAEPDISRYNSMVLRSTRFFAAAIAAGLLTRVATLPLPGTGDVRIFKAWSYHAAVMGVSDVYGRTASRHARMLAFGGDKMLLDYPPMALAALGAVGGAYRALFPSYPNNWRLTAAIKLLPLGAGLMLTWVIWSAARGRRDGSPPDDQHPRRQRWAALAYWLNPAVILQGGVLGYLGALCSLPAVAALVAATTSAGWLAGGLLAVACLVKPQALLVVPAVGVALLQPAGPRRSSTIASAAAAALLVLAFCAWPLVRSGAAYNGGMAVAHLVTDRLLSGNAANVWWIATYAHQLAHGAAATELVAHITVERLLTSLGLDASLPGYLRFALLSWSSVLAVAAWAAWQARRVSDLPRLAALAAFTVHTYAVLSIQVHENHLLFALPLLALAAAQIAEYRFVMVAVSAIGALNLNLFYGLGRGVGFAIPRAITGIDASVIVAVLNCTALCWHALVFHRACAREPGECVQPTPITVRRAE